MQSWSLDLQVDGNSVGSNLCSQFLASTGNNNTLVLLLHQLSLLRRSCQSIIVKLAENKCEFQLLKKKKRPIGNTMFL